MQIKSIWLGNLTLDLIFLPELIFYRKGVTYTLISIVQLTKIEKFLRN